MKHQNQTILQLQFAHQFLIIGTTGDIGDISINFNNSLPTSLFELPEK